MPTQLPLRCQCGQVRGLATRLDPDKLNRAVCMCDDCQTYLHFLQHAELLDAHGGTEIIQMPPDQLSITAGHEQLRCMRLSPKGMLRWYAGCCNTPIANSLSSPKVPFVGMLGAFIDPAADKDAALGPVIVRAFGKFARGGMPAGAHAKAPLGYILRSLRIFVAAWLGGRHTPTPLFDAAGKPVVEPRVLSSEERTKLRALL